MALVMFHLLAFHSQMDGTLAASKTTTHHHHLLALTGRQYLHALYLTTD